jgi:hypothetical protein
MLEAYLGQENFKKGLHIYLKRHEYGNAVTEVNLRLLFVCFLDWILITHPGLVARTLRSIWSERGRIHGHIHKADELSCSISGKITQSSSRISEQIFVLW